MDEESWKQIWQILKELEDENGFVNFPVSGTFTQEWSFETDDVFRILCEEWDPIDTSDTNLAKDMLKQIGVNV